MHHQVQPQDDFNIQINHAQINQLTNNSIWDNFNPFNEPMIQYVQQQTQSRYYVPIISHAVLLLQGLRPNINLTMAEMQFFFI